MDIKEIALKHSREYLTFKLGGRKGLDVAEIVCDDEIYAEIVDELAQQFEALISAYKAELLKEVGEPEYFMWDGWDSEWFNISKEEYYSTKSDDDKWMFYTSDQVAAAVLKATKPLEDQLAKAEQLWQIVQGRCDGLEEKLAKAEQRVAEACALQVATETKFHWLDSARVAKEIRSGEWRKFVKEN